MSSHLDKSVTDRLRYRPLCAPRARSPIRRALVIGIGYKGQGKGMELNAPYRDAPAWKQFLMDKYAYREEDIVLMLDDGSSPALLEPTDKNIREQIKKFVSGTRAGDRLMFYYAGHSTQHPCRHNTEDDMKDEAIIPSEGPDILDNDLRLLMVNTLPVGVCLTAVFDSCHSGTLLDLDHYKCNNPRFRWAKKALRKFSLPVRRASLLLRNPSSCSTRSKEELARARTFSELEGKLSTLRVYECKRDPSGTLFSRDTLLGSPSTPGSSPKSILRRLTLEMQKSGRRVSFTTTKVPRRDRTVSLAARPGAGGGQALFFSDSVLCSAPEVMKCDGECRLALPKVRADVFSIAAARDPEMAWESKSGQTMTQSLIQVLSTDLHPTFRDLILRVGQSTFESTTIPLRKWFLSRMSKWNARGCPEKRKPMDVELGSEPQLGSLNPLTGVERFETPISRTPIATAVRTWQPLGPYSTSATQILC